jgi:anaerobic magnesium-protoporphyrin IX monomethyl ester cyclase
VNLSATLQTDYRGHNNCINAAPLIADGYAVFIQPKTGDRLHAYEDAYEVDYTRSANHNKGDPDGGYRAFVFTDYVSAEQIVKLRDRAERGVRAALRIPFNPSAAARRYDHSMGQGLPDFIYRSSPSG